MDEKISVYANVNESGYILAVNSDHFLPDPTGWVKIDEGYGDRYHHAQGNYFPLPIITNGGAYRYKLVNGAPMECTTKEISEQEAALAPNPGPDGGTPDEELLAEMEDMQAALNVMGVSV